MSEIVRVFLDTETTGLSTTQKDEHGFHRIVEIGCVKTVNGCVQDKFHCYVNPGRPVPARAQEVHGLTQAFLSQFQSFEKIYQSFVDFVKGHVLVIHNARFDMEFLNWELFQLQQEPLDNPVEDTLVLARKKFPGSPASLDALCRRFRIDLSQRSYHGALLDAQLLREVYQEMFKEQAVLNFSAQVSAEQTAQPRTVRAPRSFTISPKETEDHEAALLNLKK